MLRVITALLAVQYNRWKIFWQCRDRYDLTGRYQYQRCQTRRYKAKLEIVKNLWIGSGLLMLINPVIPFVVIVSLASTFTSFMILDETP